MLQLTKEPHKQAAYKRWDPAAWLHTCHATFGCRRSRIYCVSGDGSSSYLSNGKFSITTGSHGTHENFTTGWADLGG